MQCQDADVPVIRYHFVKVSALQELEKEAICGMFLDNPSIEDDLPQVADVIGVIKEIGDLSEILTRNNKTVRLHWSEERTRLDVESVGTKTRT